MSMIRTRMPVRAALMAGTMLAVASPVLAQEAPPAPQATTVDEIVVTGFRSSLAQSTNAKRDATGFQDSIFAEDIGKFPDLNLAESLNRVPGVQLTREVNGEGLNVAIRGLGTNFTRVLLNDAQIAVASSGRVDSQNQNREVDLDLFPTELFTRLDVNKTPMASMLEGGVAGIVNMRSARPFDYSDRQITYSLQGGYSTLSEDISPRGSVIASDIWDLPGGGQFGALVGVAVARNSTRTEGFETIGWTNPNIACPGCEDIGGNGYIIPGTAPVGAGNGLTPGAPLDTAALLALNPGLSLEQLSNGIIPRLGRDALIEGDRDRDSALISLEYRPNDDLNFYVDALYSEGRRNFNRVDINWVVRNSNHMVPIGLEIDDNNVVTRGTFANSQFFLEARPYEETVDFININPGVSWRINDWLHLEGQINWSESDFFRQAPTVLFNTPLNQGLTVEYDNTSGDYPSITSNFDLNDPNLGWTWANGGRVNIQNERREVRNRGTRWDLTIGEADRNNLRIGVAYDDVTRTIEALDNSARWQTLVCGGGGITPEDPVPAPIPACTGGPGSAVTNADLANFIRPGELGFVMVDYDAFFAATNFDAFNSTAPFSAAAATGAQSGTIAEETLGAFVEFNGVSELLGRDLRYNAGVRYVTTDQEITGPQTINGELSFLTLGQTYEEFLPAFNAVWDVTDDITFRMAASRTLTRPNPSAMLPGTSFSDPSAQTASQGNPNLAPYLSTNFDIGGEWYTGGEGYVGVAFFRKAVNGFTVNGINTIPFLDLGVPFDQLTNLQQQAINDRGGPDAATVQVQQQVNAQGRLEIEGVELTWVQPLDFILEGAGFLANYTNITQESSGQGVPAVAVGVSPYTYNVTGYYERGPASIRLSYVFNDAQISSGANQNGIGVAQLRTDERGQWDLAASYDLDWLPTAPQLTLDVINLTDEPQRSTFEWDNAAFTYYEPGTTVLLGIRGRF